MKVFMITDFFRPSIGGLENSTAYLASALGARLPVEILTMEQSGPCEIEEEPELSVQRFAPRDGSPYAAMRDYIAAHPSPKAACFFGFSHSWTGPHLDFLCQIRSECSRILFKIPSLREFSLYANDAHRLEQLRAVDRFICPNPAIQAELAQGRIPFDRTVYQPNGVPCERFLPVSPTRKKALRKRLGVPRDCVFIFTGRFAARKRVGLLVEAFDRAPEATLVLVGYFDNRFDQGSSFEAPPGRNVILFGPTSDVVPYLQAADVFVSASLAEGMPNSMLEALACGLPALVTAIPGHLEVVEPGRNGEVFDPNSIDDLVAKMRRLLDRPDHLPVLSEAARETVLKRFDIELVADTYYRLLTEI